MSVNEYRNESDAITNLKARGYTLAFEVAGSSIRAVETGRIFEPKRLRIKEFHRFEGASNPEDMSVVYAIEADSGEKGTIIDAFGVYASPALAEVIDEVGLKRPARD